MTTINCSYTEAEVEVGGGSVWERERERACSQTVRQSLVVISSYLSSQLSYRLTTFSIIYKQPSPVWPDLACCWHPELPVRDCGQRRDCGRPRQFSVCRVASLSSGLAVRASEGCRQQQLLVCLAPECSSASLESSKIFRSDIQSDLADASSLLCHKDTAQGIQSSSLYHW